MEAKVLRSVTMFYPLAHTAIVVDDRLCSIR